MTKEVGGEDGVAPVGECNTSLLKKPAGVGTITVSHKQCPLHRQIDITVSRQERLSKNVAVGCFEISFGVFYALGCVIFFLRHVAPEVWRWRWTFRHCGVESAVAILFGF